MSDVSDVSGVGACLVAELRAVSRNRVVMRAAEPSAEPDVCKTSGLPTSEMPWGCSGDGRVQGGDRA